MLHSLCFPVTMIKYGLRLTAPGFCTEKVPLLSYDLARKKNMIYFYKILRLHRICKQTDNLSITFTGTILMGQYEAITRKYSFSLRDAFKVTKESYARYLPDTDFDFDFIDENALDFWERNWIPNRRSDRGNFPWQTINAKYRRKTAKYFNLSIWSDEMLCGLAIGKPSRKNRCCNLYYIEGAPMNHPLKRHIIPLCLDVFEKYAFIISNGDITVRLMDPVSDLIPFYEKLGYKTVLSGKVKRRKEMREDNYIKDGELYCMKIIVT